MTFGPMMGEAAAVTAFALDPVSPNPAIGSVRVDFAVARESNIRLAVYDVRGREVAMLAQGTHPVGRYTALWDGMGSGGLMPAGIRFVSEEAGDQSFNWRVVIAR